MLDSLLGLFLIITWNRTIIKPIFLSILWCFFRRFIHIILIIIFLIIIILIGVFNPHSHFLRIIRYFLSLIIVTSIAISIIPLVLQFKEIRTIIRGYILLLFLSLQLAFLAQFYIIKLCFNSTIELSHEGLCSFLLIQLFLYISIHVCS